MVQGEPVETEQSVLDRLPTPGFDPGAAFNRQRMASVLARWWMPAVSAAQADPAITWWPAAIPAYRAAAAATEPPRSASSDQRPAWWPTGRPAFDRACPLARASVRQSSCAGLRRWRDQMGEETKPVRAKFFMQVG